MLQLIDVRGVKEHEKLGWERTSHLQESWLHAILGRWCLVKSLGKRLRKDETLVRAYQSSLYTKVRCCRDSWIEACHDGRMGCLQCQGWNPVYVSHIHTCHQEQKHCDALCSIWNQHMRILCWSLLFSLWCSARVIPEVQWYKEYLKDHMRKQDQTERGRSEKYKIIYPLHSGANVLVLEDQHSSVIQCSLDANCSS